MRGVFYSDLTDRKVVYRDENGTENKMPQVIFDLKVHRARKQVGWALLTVCERDGRRKETPEQKAAREFLAPLLKEVSDEEYNFSFPTRQNRQGVGFATQTVGTPQEPQIDSRRGF